MLALEKKARLACVPQQFVHRPQRKRIKLPGEKSLRNPALQVGIVNNSELIRAETARLRKPNTHVVTGAFHHEDGA